MYIGYYNIDMAKKIIFLGLPNSTTSKYVYKSIGQ